MKVLIPGAGGQLGCSLLKTVPSNYQVQALSRSQLDITDLAAVRRAAESVKPEVIINAAAYTAVDSAEKEPELAFAVNARGAENLAMAARDCGARLIHVSTDFVFDGLKSSPYLPQDRANPLGAYGASKAEGENCVRRILGDSAVIVRAGWVYAVEGSNFVKTILRLLAEKDSLRVVADQVGTPTWARSLAAVLWNVVQKPALVGTYHWSDAGVASWYDFAVAIQEEAAAIGLLHRQIPVTATSTAEYPLPARRPAYSVLDKRSLKEQAEIVPVHWRTNLRKMLAEFDGR